MAELTHKKQHTIEYIAISALVMSALIIGIARFKKGDVDDEVFSRKEFNKKWKEIEILEANVPNKENKIVYAIEDESAPFKSPFDETVENKESAEIVLLPDMQFQGMIWKSSRPQAIINNKVYDVKDVISVTGGEVEVKGVDKDGIHLIYKNKEFIVRPK
ncbi:MAG: hypothetical protein COW10_03635 [Candidatus Omnitrophica bacterium CG12_big_fil_rev_8_21_14_0_65_42_8]|nr:MAG: hypothetical protein COW10_03635 [Candidatus Omnitrophica bacterium CG12_big_fil_rev_8_21_14_0_65_42_8]